MGIDLLYVDHRALELLQLTVMATIALPHGTHRSWMWCLNENLLNDTAVVSGVTDILSNYFKENKMEGLSEGIIWEGRKAVVRGELISLGSKLKKARQADSQRVLPALQQAELSHKRSCEA